MRGLRSSPAVDLAVTRTLEAQPLSTGAPAVALPDRRTELGDGALDLRCRPPSMQPGLHPRQRLTRRLIEARGRPVVLLRAPAGYGKTCLLSEWSAVDGRPFAWATLTGDDNDPATLVSLVALALDAIEPVGWEVFEALSSGRPDAGDIARQRLGRALGRRQAPFVLVLDDLHVLRSRAARAVIETLWKALPAGSQLALASRTGAELPVGRLRAQGSLVELRTTDLAMTRSEGAAVLAAAGLAVGPKDALKLVQRTEGWPVALYLAALSLRGEGSGRAVDTFAGDDRFVSEYAREELLAGLSREQLEFVTRTSILDRLSGSLCDAVLGRDDSGARLDALAAANLPLVALDRAGASYRYNALFAEALRSELRRLEPSAEAGLHRRASAWHEKHGDPDRAIAHALSAGDLPRSGRLLWNSAPACLAQGRGHVVRARLDELDERQLAETPALALVSAGCALMQGDSHEAELWTTVLASGAKPAPPRGERQRIEAGGALVRAGLARDGIQRMGADAAHAREHFEASSPWIPMCLFYEGVALSLAGETAAARARLEQGGHRAAAGAPLVQALCLAQLALMAGDEGDAGRAATLAAHARAQIERCDLAGEPLAALVLAVGGDSHRALELLGRLPDPPPWYEAECRIALAREALRTTGPTRAAELLESACRAAGRISDAPMLVRRLEQVRNEIECSTACLGGADWALTAAELRVLRHLPSHLSFREIADRLFVSPNTVKTHARAIYRKLGVSCRGEAVDSARLAGLVGSGGGG